MNDVPHTRYFGTVDATPLFLILFAEVMRWTGDLTLFHEFEPAVNRALDWIEHHGDTNGDGFIDYQRRSPQGLVHQSWKDSDDSLQFPDGSPVVVPIGPVEVQGYVYQALCSVASRMESVGQLDRALILKKQAEALRLRFEQHFWDDGAQFYGQAIDGTGQLVSAINSNPGHCLFSGIVSAERRQP